MGHGFKGSVSLSSFDVLFTSETRSCQCQWSATPQQWRRRSELTVTKNTKSMLRSCQSCQYFINLQLRQSITKHFTNHSMTTISCPTPGLEIFQHASQRPREVCKQPGIEQEQWQEEPIQYVSHGDRMKRNQRCIMLEVALISN